MSVWQLAWRVSQHERRTFWLGWALFVLFFIIPVAIGWVLSRALRRALGRSTPVPCCAGWRCWRCSRSPA